jgi:hypothetical protein
MAAFAAWTVFAALAAVLLWPGRYSEFPHLHRAPKPAGWSPECDLPTVKGPQRVYQR